MARPYLALRLRPPQLRRPSSHKAAGQQMAAQGWQQEDRGGATGYLIRLSRIPALETRLIGVRTCACLSHNGAVTGEFPSRRSAYAAVIPAISRRLATK